MSKVQYVEVRTLQNRGAVDPAPSSDVDGTLLVGKEAVLAFESNHSQYGNDDVEVFPAFYNGQRCWLVCEMWDAAEGYSASGTQERIISFEEGVKLFLEQGVFKFEAAKASSDVNYAGDAERAEFQRFMEESDE